MACPATQPHLTALLAEFLKDDDRIRALKNAPAAMTMHHAYLGGLLEHTLNVLELAKAVVPRYPDVNLDLVLAGVFLHDLGKTAELGFTTHFHYSDQGQLLGHISICVSWIVILEKLRQKGCQVRIADLAQDGLGARP